MLLGLIACLTAYITGIIILAALSDTVDERAWIRYHGESYRKISLCFHGGMAMDLTGPSGKPLSQIK
jgi:hypothetical protein